MINKILLVLSLVNIGIWVIHCNASSISTMENASLNDQNVAVSTSPETITTSTTLSSSILTISNNDTTTHSSNQTTIHPTEKPNSSLANSSILWIQAINILAAILFFSLII